jgi:hypothetical protein
MGHCQRHGFGHALDGQVAIDAGQRITIEVELGRLVGNGRVFGRIEEVFALDVAIEQFRAGIDRFGIDHGFYRAGLASAIQHDLGAGVIETALLGRIAEVAVFETSKRVVGVGREFSGAAAADSETPAAISRARIFSCETPVRDTISQNSTGQENWPVNIFEC